MIWTALTGQLQLYLGMVLPPVRPIAFVIIQSASTDRLLRQRKFEDCSETNVTAHDRQSSP
jgi:hypothetical protein